MTEVDGTQSIEAVAKDIEHAIEARLFDLIFSFIPEGEREALAGYTPTKLNLSKKYRVYRFSKDLDERYLKVVYEPSSRNPSSYEGPILATVKEQGFPFATPVVRSYFAMGPDVNGVISERVPGITVKEVFGKKLLPEATILQQWARALAKIHAFTPRQPEKFLSRSVADLIHLARQRVATHVIRPQSFSAKYGIAGPIALDAELAEVEAKCSAMSFDQLRLNHGDPCAPNFIWSSSVKDITGCVDLSGICMTDIHWDLSIACWSLNHNAKTDLSAQFLEAYSRCMRDHHSIDVRADPTKIELMYRLARFLL